jgi:hypothetical protein
MKEAREILLTRTDMSNGNLGASSQENVLTILHIRTQGERHEDIRD